ncbi:hypothetical protein [Streptosporangium lutulentum]|uniref:Membrane protein n=1 Tax=Streptosporangium lutulentum TaxID=1461250 RepID=A0ABT9QRM8_9ACTN|nr:hypothetical protein [Streptosporangium lutulentum]MDP9849401.1 putative membrane protein [Streptosporangium lutulentum]
MAYESDRWLFESAVVTTAVAAGVLKSKQAGLIAVGLAVMMCNPGSILKAAKEWMDEGQEILETVRAGLVKLVKETEANGYWGGNNQGAYSLYSEATNTLDKLMAEHAEKRQGSGEALEQKALHGHGLTVFAVSVEATMATLMSLSLGSRLLSIPAQLAVGLAIEGIVRKINSTVTAVLRKAGLATVVVADIFATVSFSCGSLVSELEKMKKQPDFAEADMRYVNGKGLTMKNSGATTVKDPGILGA